MFLKLIVTMCIFYNIYTFYSNHKLDVLNIYELDRLCEEGLKGKKSGPFFHSSEVRNVFSHYFLIIAVYRELLWELNMGMHTWSFHDGWNVACQIKFLNSVYITPIVQLRIGKFQNFSTICHIFSIEIVKKFRFIKGILLIFLKGILLIFLKPLELNGYDNIKYNFINMFPFYTMRCQKCFKLCFDLI